MIGSTFQSLAYRRLSLRERAFFRGAKDDDGAFFGGAHGGSARAGVTLIELLIVIMIMLMITAVALPVIAPAMQNRDVREAARSVDAYINGARTRALQAGHPFGVMLEREPGNPNAVSTLSYVEQPDDYTGDYQSSTIRLLGNGGFGAWFDLATLTVGPDLLFPLGDLGWPGNIAPGDIITVGTTQFRIYAGEPFIDLNQNGQWDPGEPFADVDGSGQGNPPGPGSYTPPNPATIDQATGYFNQPPQPFVYGTVGAYITYMYADPVLAGQLMTSTGKSATGQPIWFGAGVVNNLPVNVSKSGQPGFKNWSISRRPVKTTAPSIQLPGEAVIDLGSNYPDAQYSIIVPIPGSGMEVTLAQQNGTGYWSTFRANPALDPTIPNSLAGASPTTMSDQTAIVITFAPNGMVDKVYSWSEANETNPNMTVVNWTDWQGRYPASTIYLLIGRRDLVNGDPMLIANIASGVAPRKPIYNVQDVDALWVAINPRNGQVATTENIGFDLNQPIPTNANVTGQSAMQMQIYWAANVYYARRLAREQLDMTGR